jgi:sialate O-acetylesterase
VTSKRIPCIFRRAMFCSTADLRAADGSRDDSVAENGDRARRADLDVGQRGPAATGSFDNDSPGIMKPLCVRLAVLFLFVQPYCLRADVQLPAIISDHMVLTRSESVPVWGKADAGEKVTVALDGQTVETTAGPDGKWMIRLNLNGSGPGPFQLVVQGKNAITVSDVVVGSVWLAAGQSNMEFLLKTASGAEREISQSANPLLRQFRAPKVVRPQPADDCRGAWTLAGPDAVGDFTAVGYYFGKRLQQTLGSPVGLVNASWGGTFSEAWTSMDAINSVENLKSAEEQRRKIMAEYPDKKQAFVTEFAAWLKANQREDKPSPEAAVFAAAEVALSDWIRLKLPGPISATGLPANGAVWIRREVEVPPGAVRPGQDFKVLVGQLEGFERVYWNGSVVSETPYAKYPGVGYPRYFGIPSAQVKIGKNTIAIRIYAPVRSPALAVDPSVFRAGPISLAGEWLAKAEYELPALAPGVMGAIPRAPARPPAMMAGGIFNGVVHPLIPYALSGVIWYQGESNAGRAVEYRSSFPLLINDWRKQWRQEDLPFYFCQLPNYGPKLPAPAESEWAELREAQSLALNLPNTAQAVLIDLGESGDNHPRNKTDVGERLARIALAKRYDKNVACHGPAYESMTIEGDKVRVKFSHAEGGLVSKALGPIYDVITKIGEVAPLVRNSPASELEGFSICGEDRHWVWADAKIDGATVMIWSNRIPHPIAVRYAWADNPTCNLENGAGLPASPFRTDSFPSITARNHFGPGS